MLHNQLEVLLEQINRKSQQRNRNYKKELHGNYRTEKYHNRNKKLSGTVQQNRDDRRQNQQPEDKSIEFTEYEQQKID